ncbi:hypothetical protein B0H12DRAFT_1295142 [Mycena haematopus]|nr:hypothetical protein B0H12DRAFT_1295142 [Mycena haematopus]
MSICHIPSGWHIASPLPYTGVHPPTAVLYELRGSDSMEVQPVSGSSSTVRRRGAVLLLSRLSSASRVPLEKVAPSWPTFSLTTGPAASANSPLHQPLPLALDPAGGIRKKAFSGPKGYAPKLPSINPARLAYCLVTTETAMRSTAPSAGWTRRRYRIIADSHCTVEAFRLDSALLPPFFWDSFEPLDDMQDSLRDGNAAVKPTLDSS